MKMNYLKIIFLLTLVGTLLGACKDEPPKTPESTTNAPQIINTGNPAIDGLSSKIAQAPKDATLYAARAGSWLELEGYDEAISDLEKAISIDSLIPEYHHALADAYLDYYKSRKALETMVNAATIFPKRIGTLLKLAEFQHILKQYRDALFTLERIRVIEPNTPEMFFMFGLVFQEMGRIDEAKGAYQKAVESNPDLIDAWINFGKILGDEKNPLAERYFENALRVNPNSVPALHAMAFYLANQKNDIEGGIEYYKRVNVADPQFEEGYYNLGLVYLDADSLDQAYKSFDLAIKIKPDYAESYFFRGMASKMKGNLEAAKTDFQQSLSLNPEYEYAQKELANLQ